MNRWFLFLSCVCALPLTSGGPGFALHWDRSKTDIVSWLWPSIPQVDGLSIEFWFKILDPYVEYNCPFNVGVEDFTTSYVNPSEISVYIATSYIGVWLVDREFDCDMVVRTDQWYHVAFTYNYSSAEVFFYINGILAESCNNMGTPGTKPHSNGHAVMGYEQLSFQNSLNSDGAFDGMIDEFRVWEGVRLAEGIFNWYDRSLDLNDSITRENLSIYFNFDHPNDSPFLNDETGQIVAYRGQMQGYVQRVSFGQRRPDSLPTPPQFLISEISPFHGSGPLIIPVLNLNETLNFTLIYSEDKNFASAQIMNNFSWNGQFVQKDGSAFDSFGLVSDPLFELRYAPPISISHNTTFLVILDELNYVIHTNLTNTTITGKVMFVWGVTLVQNIHLTCKANSINIITLSGIDALGHKIPVEIVSFETGTLYAFEFNQSFVCEYGTYSETCEPPSYLNVLRNSTTNNLTKIPSTPFLINNTVAAVLYQPETDFVGETVGFTFRYTSAPLETAQLVLDVAAINKAPIAQPLSIVVSESPSTVSLNSTDDGLSLHYYITEWPKFGTLKDAVTGLTLDKYERLQVFHWAETIEDFSTSVGDSDWSPVQVLGGYNFFPDYGASPLGWQPDKTISQWIIIGFRQLLFVDIIEVFEIFHPGQIVKISVSDHFMDVNESLSWEVLWSTSTLAPVSAMFAPNIFSPPLCPTSKPQRYARIDITQARYPYEMDAVRFTGGFQPPAGLLQTNQVIYEPALGIYTSSRTSELDSLVFVASDCSVRSIPQQVTFLRTAPTNVDNASIFQTHDIAIRVELGDAFYSLNHSSFYNKVCQDLTSRGIAVDCSLSRMQIFSPPDHLILALNGHVLAFFPVWVNLSDTISARLLKSDAQVSSANLTVWIHNDHFVHNVMLKFLPECKMGSGFMQLEGLSCSSCGMVSKASLNDQQRLTFTSYCPVPCQVDQGIANGLAVPTALFLAFATFCVVWTVLYSESRVVYFSGRTFLLLQAGGLIISVLGIQLAFFDVCFSPWFIHTGMVLCLTCAITKSFRIERVFTLSNKMQASPWGTKHMRILVILPVLCALIVLAISEVIRPTVTVGGCCQYNQKTIAVLAAFELTLAILGSILAFRTRNVPSRFNESKYLAFSMYNTLFCGLVCIILQSIFLFGYDAMLVLQYVVFFWVSLFLVLGNFVPKIYSHWQRPMQAAIKLNNISNDSGGDASGSKGRAPSNRADVMQSIQAEIEAQEQELVRTRNLQGKTLNALEDLRANEKAIKLRSLELVTELEYLKTHESVKTAQLSSPPVLVRVVRSEQSVSSM